MSIRIFEGELTHQNPICTECNNHTYTLYVGGRKDKVENMFFCKKCEIIYKLPTRKKCKDVEFAATEIVEERGFGK